MKFQDIHPEDKPLLQPYLSLKTDKCCDLAFGNLYLWSKKFVVKYAIENDCLLFRKLPTPGSYCFPCGEDERVRELIARMCGSAQEKKEPFSLYLVSPADYKKLERWFPGVFQVTYDRDLADYVYETKDLIRLAGQKYHGKRNHINKFKSLYPDWSYEALNRENAEECFQMVMQWRNANNCEEDEDKRHEVAVTMNALRLFEELGLSGGLIRAKGRVVAFTVGEELNDDMFVIHIEKAFADVSGAYPMINQQFLRQEAASYRYVNREEDTGSPGLRKAKLSYHPAFLMQKGIAVPVRDLQA